MHPITRRLIARTPPRLRRGVTLGLRTIDDSIDDRIPGLAAEVAFFVILSLPPLLLALLATIGFAADALGTDWQTQFAGTIVDLARNIFTPRTVQDVIEPSVRAVTQEGRGDIASFSFLLALYSASRAVRVIVTAITVAYDLEDRRSRWHHRVWGLGLTVIGIVIGLVLVPLLVVGPQFGETISRRLPIDPGFGTLWRIGFWPGAVVVATLLVAALYHFGAPWSTPWRRDLPGAALAMALWLAGSFGLRVYTARTISGENSIYGPIAAPLILLLWLYVSAFAVLLGAELNAEIERMWPSHRDVTDETEAEAEAEAAPIIA